MHAQTMTAAPVFTARAFAVAVGLAVPLLVLGRVVLAAFVGLAFLLVFACERKEDLQEEIRRQAGRPVGVLALATFFLWFASMFGSLDSIRSIEAATRTLIFLAAAVVMCFVLARDQRRLNICLRALVIGTLATVIYAVVSYKFLPELYWFTHLKGWRPGPLDLHLRAFGALSAILIPAVLWAGYRLGRNWLICAVIATAGFTWLIIQTYNKAPIAGLLAAAIVVVAALLWRRDTRRWALPLGVVLAAVTAAVVWWIFQTRGWLLETGPEGDWILPLWLLDYQRQSIWMYTWGLAQQSPWVGHGINTINFMPGADEIISRAMGYPHIPGHPHNWAVEVLSETGWIGFVPFVATIAAAAWLCFDRFRRLGDIGALAALAIAAAYWGSGLFNFSYWSAWWQMSFFVLSAICLAGASRDQDHL